MLAGLDRHQRWVCCGCIQRLPWCWTEEAAPWKSQQLAQLLILHIVGTVSCIALCWCWQYLLMVGGNLLSHIVTPLDVTTVAWCCRQTQDVLHTAECQQQSYKHHCDSGQQVSSIPVIALEDTYNCLFTDKLCLGLLVFHIAGMVLCIALCWCWQCLLTVGGNLLPHIVTPLDVTTVVRCCRQTKEFLQPAECQQQHCKHHSDSGQQVSSLHDCTGNSFRLFTAFNSTWHCGLDVGQI